MLLVTGGINDFIVEHDKTPSSTEVYYPSAGDWREVPGALPRPMYEARMVTLNNKVLLFGEMIILKLVYMNSINCCMIGSGSDILQFSDSEGEEKWTKIGEMSPSRAEQAVSIVDMNKFKKYCQYE